MRPSVALQRWIPVLITLATACGGSSHSDLLPPVQGPVAGRYDLIAYEAKVLPDTLRVIAGNSSTPGGGSVSCPEILRGATLDIATDAAGPTFTRTSRLAYPCTGTLPRPSSLPDSVTRVETGHVTVVETGVVMSFDGFADTTSLERAEYGHIQGQDIVIDRILSGAPPGSSESLANARVYRHE